MRITIHVQPGAKKSGYAGLHGGNPKIKLAAIPEGGEANAELIIFLAKKLGLTKSQIKIVSGHTSRIKIIEIDTENDSAKILQFLEKN